MPKWNSEIPWVKDSNYILRVTDATFGPSKSSGKPMITLKYEVVSPETMTATDGVDYEIAGVSYGLTQYMVTKSIDEQGNVDLEKQKSIVTRLDELYRTFGMDFSKFDPDNVDVEPFKGKTVYALVYNDTQEQRKSPTAKDLAEGKKQGEVMLHPLTKKPLMSNSPKIGEIFGLAPVDGGKPY